MTQDADDAPKLVLTVLAGLIAPVVGGVLALAVGRHLGAVRTAAVAISARDEPQGRIDFGIASSALPPEAEDVLGPVASAARADPGKIVLISGSHGAGENAALGARRAEAVRHALEADGVAADKLVVETSRRTTADRGAGAGRSVEMRVR